MVNATMATANNGERSGEDLPLGPFVRGSRHRAEPFLDRSDTLGASAIQRGPEDVAAFGFIRHVLVLVEGTVPSANAAAVAFAADGPFSVLDSVTLQDVNGNPLVGPFSGYDLYLANKYGAYAGGLLDARQSPSYSAVTGTDDAGGNFSFLLRLPVEISGRDALGALTNQNAGQTYKVGYTIAPSGNVYDTAPTALPTVRVRAWLEAWTPPKSADLLGNPVAQMPPAHGTLQMWTRYTETIASGSQQVRLPRVGNQLRTIVAVIRDGDGARVTANWPDPVQLRVDGNTLDNVARSVARHRIAEQYGFDAAADAAGGLDSGVFVWSFANDLDGRPGYEMRDAYLPTTQATRLELDGSWGGAGTLAVLTNDVASAGNIFAS